MSLRLAAVSIIVLFIVPGLASLAHRRDPSFFHNHDPQALLMAYYAGIMASVFGVLVLEILGS